VQQGERDVFYFLFFEHFQPIAVWLLQAKTEIWLASYSAILYISFVKFRLKIVDKKKENK
jgi:hypothetical protein